MRCIASHLLFLIGGANVALLAEQRETWIHGIKSHPLVCQGKLRPDRNPQSSSIQQPKQVIHCIHPCKGDWEGGQCHFYITLKYVHIEPRKKWVIHLRYTIILTLSPFKLETNTEQISKCSKTQIVSLLGNNHLVISFKSDVLCLLTARKCHKRYSNQCYDLMIWHNTFSKQASAWLKLKAMSKIKWSICKKFSCFYRVHPEAKETLCSLFILTFLVLSWGAKTSNP